MRQFFLLFLLVSLFACEKEEDIISEPILQGDWGANFTEEKGKQVQELTFGTDYFTRKYANSSIKSKYYTKQVSGGNYIYYIESGKHKLYAKYEFWHPNYLYLTRHGKLSIFEKK